MTEHDSPRDGNPTRVNIFGRTYNLRGHSDPVYLEELASLVDGKMREVAEVTGTADTLKVAILASLNIADDYLQASRRRGKSHEGAADKRLARMVSVLDEALAG
jgi:cell division protein ZapA